LQPERERDERREGRERSREREELGEGDPIRDPPSREEPRNFFKFHTSSSKNLPSEGRPKIFLSPITAPSWQTP
jgi:hypothetical protein